MVGPEQTIPPPGIERDRLIAKKLGLHIFDSGRVGVVPTGLSGLFGHVSTDPIAFTRLRLYMQKELGWDFAIYAAGAGDTAVMAFRVGANRMSRAQNKDEADAGTRAILEAMG